MQRCGGRRAAPTMFRGDLLLSGASLPCCAKKCKHVTSKNSWRIQQIIERKTDNIDKIGRKWNFQRSSYGIVGRFLHFLALFAPFTPARLRAQGVQQDQKDLEHGADDVDKKQPVPVRREVQTQTAPQMISEQAKICESWLLQSAQKTCATIPEMGMP